MQVWHSWSVANTISDRKSRWVDQAKEARRGLAASAATRRPAERPYSAGFAERGKRLRWRHRHGLPH